MFNKVKDFSVFADNLNLVLKVEGMENVKLNALLIFKKFIKGETIKLESDGKKLWIVKGSKMLRKDKISYIVKSDNEHKKVWIKESSEGLDFIVFDYNKSKYFDESSRFAFVYYPISKGKYLANHFVSKPTSMYRDKDDEILEIEKMMM